MNVSELKAAIRNIDKSAKINGLRKAELEEMLVALRAESKALMSAHYAPKAAYRIRKATGFDISVHKTEIKWTVEMGGAILWMGTHLDTLVSEIEARPEAASKWLLAATL